MAIALPLRGDVRRAKGIRRPATRSVNRNHPCAMATRINIILFNNLFAGCHFSRPILSPLPHTRLLSPCPSLGNAVRDGASWRWDGSLTQRRRTLAAGPGNDREGACFFQAGPFGNAVDPAATIPEDVSSELLGRLPARLCGSKVRECIIASDRQAHTRQTSRRPR